MTFATHDVYNDEVFMRGSTPAPRPNSRLDGRVSLAAGLDNLLVRVPEEPVS